ncbi:DUF3857 domain-containing protein [Mucilaginibacter galii]|uniref:Transglutaminase-like domain-containing protein n=1 Tax=Mucilaginibacter galii TaxID=2005073 RepID=A0A917MZZ6_9SPHI|nr:DUF3857 domain-containing protein [Mucilaginibacter galii]GGI48814.1 hypothetical protein GCM10011425_00260 [Mucilaginibacter galii]
MKKLLLLFSAVLLSQLLYAQDFPYDSYNLSDLEMKSYEKDKTAHAVVLKEFGKTWISSGDGLPLYHEYHVKIKIFDSKAFDEGNITIPIHKSDNNDFEQVRDVVGVTYYTDEQGNVQRSYLDPKTVVTENRNKYWDLVKFAMPNLRNGCVIEYKYTLQSPYSLTFRDWDFQGTIPKIYSEYEAHIPGVFNFKASLRGFYKLDKNVSEIEHECFSAGGTKCDCSKITYAMKDVPAFVKEDYMTAPKNFLSAINFELNDYINPYNGQKTVKTQTWADIDYNMKHHEEFGVQMRKTSVFKDKLPAITGGATDNLEKAKAIYHYIQSNLKHNRFIGIYSDNGLRKTLDTHSGSTADINLALVTALKAAGIDAEAVLLSTRDHGFISKLYPAIGDFNYVVAKANIGDKSYMLDATDALMPFGLLPEECINDQGRVMSLDKPSYWIDMVAAQKRTRTHIMNLTLQTNGKLTGKLIYYSNGYEALEKRRSIKKFNSIDEYVENLDEKMAKVKISKYDIKNVDSLENSLIESYDVEIDVYNNMDAGRLAFNPYMLHRMTDNPFKLEDRTYPVDMGTATDTRIVLTVTLPEQYTVETAPENKATGLPNQGGRFITSYETNPDGFTFSHIIQLNKPIYSSDEYPYLKEFYNTIIKAEKADIIFKKKS